VLDGLLRTDPGERPHLQLGPLGRVRLLLGEHGAQPAEKKDSGIDTRPGLLSGNQEKSTFWTSEGLTPVTGFTGAPDTTGEKMINVMHAIRPPYIDHSAPWVVNRLQNSV
jgi:hypothetical protein